MRQETTTRTLYTFDELSPEVQQKVIERYQESAGEFFDGAEFVYDDAAIIADLFGLDIRQRRRTSKDGSKTWYDPEIFYSGFWSQGDGACFEGYYRYKPGALKAVKGHAGQDKELHRIVASLQDIQRRNFYQLTARCKHAGHYHHSGCMSVDVERTDGKGVSRDTEEDITQALRDFADWIYNQLEEAYDYDTSEENARDYLKDSDDEYTEDGGRA